jgi:hypothetical protein
MAKRAGRIEIEPCVPAGEIRRTYDGAGKLVCAELWHKSRRHGWRLVVDRDDPDGMRYTTLDGLGAYIHSWGRVGYYTAWGDGEELSYENVPRDVWLARCFDDMRRRARHLLDPKPPTPAPPAVDVRAMNDEAGAAIEAGRIEDARTVLARARAALDARGELVVDDAHVRDVLDWYIYYRHTLELAARDARWAEHREDAARLYVLENALVTFTGRANWADPLGPPVADPDFVFSDGLRALLVFQTRTGHFVEAERILAAELADAPRVRMRLDARREQAEDALGAGLRVFVEQKNARAIRRGNAAFRAIRRLASFPRTPSLAHLLSRFHAYFREWAAAVAMAERAVAVGLPRADVADDPDLAPVRARLAHATAS